MNDVFVSYAAADAVWVRTLAEHLVGHGLSTFFDQWSVEPGQVVIHELEKALLSSTNGIAVISPASLRSTPAMDEYAALATASAARGLRFIPVLLGHVDTPPFAGNRVWRDFSDASGQEFTAKVAELAAVIAGRAAPTDGTSHRDNLAASHPSPPQPLTPPEHPAFVVCYAPADAAYGSRLAEQLRTAGLPVWSTGDLRPGDAQFWTIRQQLRHAVAVIVVMTPQSQDSEDVTRMILEGQVHGRPFVPVLLDGDVNYHLAATWHVDARDGALLDDVELDLLRTLRRDVERGRPARLPGAGGVRTAPVVRMTVPASLERLRDHLAEGEYEHADLLTTRLVLETAGRLGEGWLSERHVATVPLELLAGIDALWTAHSQGRQGFRRQCAMAPVDGWRRGPRFPELGAALGWRDSAEAAVPRLYHDFAERAGPGRRSGFFPTLRDPGHENAPDWYDRWSSTVLAVHARLREWRTDPC
ncbi:TIR domain-containing protein [Streptomyces triticiradicis]|uniref:TIR domain-containing protein n=1 Tax=Streptomyces triticiradicis TaxID=2651189 RepID=A0A7J5D4G6_9ACTN|nr:TIR domain-containing protein [Streptomyces triticiradicis]KAB1978533.1 TIR domain-containing protein [Streptomyces triticiradicis]